MQSIQGLALADDRRVMVIAHIDGGGSNLMQSVTVERGCMGGVPLSTVGDVVDCRAGLDSQVHWLHKSNIDLILSLWSLASRGARQSAVSVTAQ